MLGYDTVTGTLVCRGHHPDQPRCSYVRNEIRARTSRGVLHISG